MNLRLTYDLLQIDASRYKTRGMTTEDLVQEAMLDLWRYNRTALVGERYGLIRYAARRVYARARARAARASLFEASRTVGGKKPFTSTQLPIDEFDRVAGHVGGLLAKLLARPQSYYEWAVTQDRQRMAAGVQGWSVANHPTSNSIAKFLGVSKYKLRKAANAVRREEAKCL